MDIAISITPIGVPVAVAGCGQELCPIQFKSSALFSSRALPCTVQGWARACCHPIGTCAAVNMLILHAGDAAPCTLSLHAGDAAPYMLSLHNAAPSTLSAHPAVCTNLTPLYAPTSRSRLTRPSLRSKNHCCNLALSYRKACRGSPTMATAIRPAPFPRALAAHSPSLCGRSRTSRRFSSRCRPTRLHSSSTSPAKTQETGRTARGLRRRPWRRAYRSRRLAAGKMMHPTLRMAKRTMAGRLPFMRQADAPS